MDGMESTRRKSPQFWMLLVIALILTGWALKAASSFVIPTVVAFLIAVALAPLDAAVRSRMPKRTRWLGHLLSMLVLIVLLGTFFAGIWLAAQQVAQKFPGSFSNMGQVIEQTATPADESRQTARAGDGGGVLGRLQGWKGELGELVKERGTGFAGTILNRMATFLVSLVLVLFLALLLLIEAPHWRDKARTIFTREEESQWMQALDQTARNLRIFVVTKTATGLATALLYVGWLAIMGLDLLLVWGVLTFLLSYVPVIGSVIAGLAAAGYAFFQLDIYWAVVTGLGLLAIEQVMGNYVEPRVLGRQLALSSFVVLVSLLVWGWLWGVAGALLATPMLILILNVAAHVGSLRPVAVFLSENGEESVRALHAEEQA